jgi:hypothetical protein
VIAEMCKRDKRMFASISIQKQENRTFVVTGLPKKKRLLCSATRARTVRGGKGRVSPSVGRRQAGTCG